MALQLKDRVSSGCTATGTNDIVFGDDTPSFHNWSVVDNGSTVYYCIVDKDEFEVGQGIKSTNGITRDLIFTSTNGGAKINLSGNADVFLTYPADKAVAKDENGNVTIDGNITADNLTLEGLGIPNHDKVIVNENGKITVDNTINAVKEDNSKGAYITNLGSLEVWRDDGIPYIDFKTSDAVDYDCRIQQKDLGLQFYTGATAGGVPERMTIDSTGKVTINGSLATNSIGLSNDWSIVGQPTSFNIAQSGANKVTVSDAGALTATSLSGALNGSDLVDASVTNAKLVDKTVTGAKIADNTVTPTQLNVSGNGANDQLLASSGNGSMKWVDASGGGRELLYHLEYGNNVRPQLTGLNNKYKKIEWEFENPTGPVNYPFLVVNINGKNPAGNEVAWADVSSKNVVGDTNKIHSQAPGIRFSQHGYPESTPAEGHAGYNEGFLQFVGSNTGGQNSSFLRMHMVSNWAERGYTGQGGLEHTSAYWHIGVRNDAKNALPKGIDSIQFLTRGDTNNNNEGIYFRRCRIWGIPHDA